MKHITISVKSSFCAKHSHTGLLNEPSHKHNFIYTITLKGPINNEGFVSDFREVEQVLNKLNSTLEGKDLNDILPFPTTENLALFLFEKIKKELPLSSKITLQEKENYFVTYEE